MIFALVFSALLLLSLLPLNLTYMASRLPAGVRLLPLFTTALLWLHTLLFRLQGRGGAGGVLLLVLFYFMAIALVFLPALSSLLFAVLDRPHDRFPAVYGDESASKEIYLVVHPGASDFPSAVTERLAEQLAAAGFRVTVHTARADLRLEIGRAEALGLISPLYAGSIRPPLMQFIANNKLKKARCFLLLTGKDSHRPKKDLARAEALVKAQGGKVIAGAKAIARRDRGPAFAVVERLVAELAGKL
jgi:hypothetical protein